MKSSNTLKWSLTVALAGFLFGFDTVVISGANAPTEALWFPEDAWSHGIFIMSMALWGTVLGSLAGGIPCDILGRKKTLFWIGVLYFVSAVGSGLATDPYLFSFFRFLGGVGVGASSVAAPAYISEISSAKNRGKFVALYQFNLVLGIVIAFTSNAMLSGFGGANDWRWMLGVEAIPALIYTLLVMAVPKSPRWLIAKRNDEAGARAVLSDVYTEEEVEDMILNIKKDNEKATQSKRTGLFQKKYSKVMLLAFLIAFFNQLSGINFVLYFAPELLEQAGFGVKGALQNSIFIGLVNLIFTFIGVYLIDKLGRKSLMLIGSIGYIASLGLLAWAYNTGASAITIISLISFFVASHAIGQGAVIWVFISEIFPNKVRGAGQSFGTGTHWVFAAIITMVGPVVIDKYEANPAPIFAFFAAFMVLQLLFTIFLMPETKGVSLEDLNKQLVKEN